MNFKCSPFCLILFSLFLCDGLQSAELKTNIFASAGWSEIEITPPLGIALGGRGTPATPSKKVLDPLFAQVLYLKDAKGTGFVLVSFDLISLPHELSERIRLDIVHEFGVPWNLIVLNCSHTHSGPYMIRSLMAGVGPAPQIEIEYFKTLEQKIVLATRAATKVMMPVKVEIFSGVSEVAINRRGKNKKGESAMLPNANGPFDEKLWVLKLSPENNKSPALIFSYACHPVIVYGYNFSAISADFPGVARNVLREKLGEKVHAQFVQGLAGDVRPRAVADLKNNRFRAATPADLQKAGTDLANDVLTALKNKSEILALDIAGASDRPLLPRDKPPEREYYETLKREAATKTNKFQTAVSEYWLSCYDSGFGFAKGDAWPVGLIRLAENQWVCYFAGEPCVEWRAKISQWLPGKKIVPWGYCQEGVSYLPTEEMLPEGGYEVADSNRTRLSTPAQHAPGINEAIRESFLRQLSFINTDVK
ncbi:MAG: neutral/alkaline non-lysosomal ceramidase N-terminal domain-containing protein [Verrucomicrobiota bacterium]